MKWGDLKASIAKFLGYYEQIKALDESGRTYDNDILVALQLFETLLVVAPRSPTLCCNLQAHGLELKGCKQQGTRSTR